MELGHRTTLAISPDVLFALPTQSASSRALPWSTQTHTSSARSSWERAAASTGSDAPFGTCVVTLLGLGMLRKQRLKSLKRTSRSIVQRRAVDQEAAVEAGRYRALTKIRLRSQADVNSTPTGLALAPGEVFIAEEVVHGNNLAYLRVAGDGGWAFHMGIAGDWLGRPIIERIVESSEVAPPPDAEDEEEKRLTREQEEMEKKMAPKGPRDVDVTKLLSWCRTQSSFKMHPGLAVRDGQLVASMPIAEGTPLIGVMPQHILDEGYDAEGDDEAQQFEYRRLLDSTDQDKHLKLALRILKEASKRDSSREVHLKTLPRRAASPMLWTADQIFELQHDGTRRAVQELDDSVKRFYEQFVQPSTLLKYDKDGEKIGLEEFRHAVAKAMQRGVNLPDGRCVLIPLLDLVKSPEEQGVDGILEGGKCSTANCELKLEGEGSGSIPVLYAARSLAGGEVLTRELGLESPLDLLLRNGLARPPRSDDSSTITATLDSSVRKWQLEAIMKGVKTRPGRLQGEYSFAAEVRRGADLSEALSPSLMHVARTTICSSEEELDVYVGGDLEDRSEPVSTKAGVPTAGLAGLSGEKLNQCVEVLTRMLKGSRGEMGSSIEDDIKHLPNQEGVRKVAMFYRIGKKLVLEEVLSLLERSKEAEEEVSSSAWWLKGK
eukprot:TRINITY_DN41923_c0_g1_i1.p1 TRINITY_DN41923_c0_g1~~TRINITY_DN41923_c0_g1_i1.p1  ORF type:complete len:687 (+),score=155.74 TRINITY_DN41923_c0_g1_i1:80-2062(+)